MRKLLIALFAGALFCSPALADWTGKDASSATITFKNPVACASVVCVPVVQLYDGTNVVTLTTAGADGASNTLTGVPTYARMQKYNGTTWDRWTGAVTVASGGIASGAMVDLGSQADAACGTDNGTCSAIALIKRGNQTATTTATAVQAAVPAGEAHIGEIGSNQIKVQVAQTVTASAYSAGNALGGLMTVANAARVSGSAGAAGTGGILTGLQLNSKTIQSGVQVDVFIFDANPTGSTCTDKTAFVIAAADFDKVVGILTIPSTPANGAGWFGATTTGAVGIPSYFPVTYDLASSTSIYACAVVRAAITPAATTDISFKYNILRN